MDKSIKQNPKCVISGSLCGWGDVFIPKFDLVIFIYTPANIRIKRLEKREFARFGARIRGGGDMYEEHKRFMAWAGDYDTLAPPQRCKTLHEEWLMKL
ncbi:MAG: shikimate kinase, partial [Oscillospiraceae bacterium]|nr:shikimate kinase [Oscillospiraceae bacterium]